MTFLFCTSDMNELVSRYAVNQYYYMINLLQLVNEFLRDSKRYKNGG
jgi:hypothetical protein